MWSFIFEDNTFKSVYRFKRVSSTVNIENTSFKTPLADSSSLNAAGNESAVENCPNGVIIQEHETIYIHNYIYFKNSLHGFHWILIETTKVCN